MHEVMMSVSRLESAHSDSTSALHVSIFPSVGRLNMESHMATDSGTMPSSSSAQKAQLSSDDSNAYDYAFISLCAASYATHHDKIPGLISAVPSWNGTGQWKCVWGPTSDLLGANLAFVASYIAGDTGLPICAALVIRGTDKTESIGELIEAIEDLHVGGQVAYTLAGDPTVRIAKGSSDGLKTIQNLYDLERFVSLKDFVEKYIGDAQNGQPVMVVTGHSLGGCLTTVVAPWIKTLIPAANPIKTVTFAAPTAGNQAFASWYASTIEHSMLYYNTIDIVPMAYSSLTEIYNMFPNGPSIPGLAHTAVHHMIGATTSVDYTQTKPSEPLKGTLTGTSNWYSEVFSQHNHLTYINLMAGIGTSSAVTYQELVAMMERADTKLVQP